jgi:hypothetical protein
LFVASNNVVIKGIKFIGNPKNLTGIPRPEAFYYYPIAKENKDLKNLEVSQCYFIAEKNSAPIQGAIYAQGPNTHVDHCIFYNCRNGILLFTAAEGFSITNCIIYGAYESAVWMGPVDSAFRFENNIITKDYKNVVEKNITKMGAIDLIEMTTETLPGDFLQVLPGSPGSTIGAGIFSKK